MMTAEVWRNKIKELVQRISDRQYQEQAWFGEGPRISSPEEMYCQLFDDFMFDQFLIDQAGSLTSKQLTAATNLKRKMEEYPLEEATDPSRVIDDPEWSAVRAAAREFADALGEADPAQSALS